MPYVNTRSAVKHFGVHPNTLRQWDKDGKIKTIRTPSGKRLYDIGSYVNSNERTRIIYARVSSKSQKDDLRKQIEHLRSRYPEHELVEDIASGLNFKRKGFNSILERVMSGTVSEIVVAHRDRLCRFGFDLLQSIASRNNCKIVVLDNSSLSPQEELVRDLLSIIHVFSCRLYGLRKYSSKIKEDKDLPQKQETT